MRGVGRSGGATSWTGIPESNDLVELCRHLLSLDLRGSVSSGRLEQKIILVGYSFGSLISARALALDPSLYHGIIMISMPYQVMFFLTCFHSGRYTEAIESSTVPKLFVMGSRDTFMVPNDKSYNKWLDRKVENAQTVLVQGPDHFWSACEDHLCKVVIDWLSKLL